MNAWTQKADFAGAGRATAVGFAIGNRGYIGTGGTGTNNLFKDFWEYNPKNDVWTRKADFGGTPRFVATGFSMGNNGYIGTGWDNTGNRNDFWEYTPDTNLTGINEFSDKSSIDVYPNPFSIQTSVYAKKAFQGGSITLFNTLGQPVKTIENINGNSVLISRENLNAGIYILRVSSNNDSYTIEKTLIVTDN
ncbi:MAG: T9SS type A sorting domain-containing protein [Bacteroidota bacterium]|nr:T9SS type A sorting domain-containing protein [Bacteroidota bacterium]